MGVRLTSSPLRRGTSRPVGDAAPGANGLAVHGLSVNYGGGDVVRSINLAVSAGRSLAIVGPNGAGKSSTLNAIAGFAPLSSGGVTLGKFSVERWSAERRARAGIVIVPEGRGLFPRLTVDDHIRLSVRRRPNRDVWSLVESWFPLLPKLRRRQAGLLSGGEAQMLAIASAMLLKPRLLLIDELSFGLAPMVVRDILATLRKSLDDAALSLVIVEQFVDLALEFADDAAVMVRGQFVLHGSAGSLRSRTEEIDAAYLKGDSGAPLPSGAPVKQGD